MARWKARVFLFWEDAEPDWWAIQEYLEGLGVNMNVGNILVELAPIIRKVENVELPE